MIVIGLTDVHSGMAAIERMNDIIGSADVVLFVGDITNFGREPETAQVVAPVVQLARKTLAVSGNCDYPEVDAYLDRQGINLHGRGEMVDGIGFVGLGGSLTTPFKTPNEYSEAEIEVCLNRGFTQLPEKAEMQLVLVSHQPPVQTLCDRISTGVNVGSHAVRRFIEARQPLVCFTGHIHESVALDNIGDTRIVNPGMLANGQYAYAEIGQGKATVEIRRF
jgi:uncharacterized protein